MNIPSAYRLRPLNGAHPIAVQTDAAGNPIAVRRSGWRQPCAVLEVQDRWRIDDEWWRERPISRLYHIFLLDGGIRLTVYQDLLAGSWFEQRDSGPRTGSQPERQRKSRSWRTKVRSARPAEALPA